MKVSARCAAVALATIVATALGKEQEIGPASPALRAYQYRIAEVIGKAWYQKVSRSWRDLSIGTVQVSLYVMPSGAPRDIRITAKPHDRASADLLRDVLRGIRFPPIPGEVLRELPEGRMPADFKFTLYPQADRTKSSNRAMQRTAR